MRIGLLARVLLLSLGVWSSLAPRVYAQQPATKQSTPFVVLAPVQTRVFGQSSVSYDYQFQKDEASTTTTDTVTSLSGQALTRGYIWRPWFSKTDLNGTLSLDFSTTDSDASSSQTLGLSLNGTGTVQILPTSRFPFTATLARDDSRIDTGMDINVRDRTRLTLTQRYRPLSQSPTFRGRYEYQLTNSNDESKQKDQSLELNAEHRLKAHQFSTTFNYELDQSESVQTEGADEDETFTLFGNHGYSPQPNFSIQTFASAVQQTQITSDNTQQTELWQVSSNSTYYIPSRALSLSSNFRASEVSNESVSTEGGETSANVNSFAGGLAMEQRLTKEVQIGATAAADRTITDTSGTTSFAESIRASYTPDSILLGDYQYRWSIGGSGNFTQAEEETTEELSYSYSQGLSSSYVNPDDGTSEEFRLQQSLNKVIYNSEKDEEGLPLTLDHSLTQAWRASEASIEDFVQVNIRDSREYHAQEDTEQQLVNFQVTRNVRSLKGGLWFANFTQQLSRDADETVELINLTSNGNITYGRNELFRTRGLSFQSQLGASYSTAIKGAESSEDDKSLFWNNELRYELGRLRAEVDTTFNWTNDTYDGSVVLKVTRLWDSL